MVQTINLYTADSCMSRRVAVFVFVLFVASSRSVEACRLSTYGELVDCVGAPYLPLELFTIVSLGGSHGCGVRFGSGRVVCWDSIAANNSLNYTHTASAAVNSPVWVKDVRALSLGVGHSCALWGPRDTLTCWGGDVGLSSPINVSHKVEMLAVGHPASRHVCFLRMGGPNVACFGSNTFGQLGLGTAGGSLKTLPAEHIP
jgi:hypothetical protein